MCATSLSAFDPPVPDGGDLAGRRPRSGTPHMATSPPPVAGEGDASDVQAKCEGEVEGESRGDSRATTYAVCLILLVSSAIWLYSERRSAICCRIFRSACMTVV